MTPRTIRGLGAFPLALVALAAAGAMPPISGDPVLPIARRPLPPEPPPILLATDEQPVPVEPRGSRERARNLRRLERERARKGGA